MEQNKRGLALSGSEDYGFVTLEESLKIDPSGKGITFEEGVSNANSVVSVVGDIAGIGLDIFSKINDPVYDKELQTLVQEGKILDREFQIAQSEFMKAQTTVQRMNAEIKLQELQESQRVLAQNAVAVGQEMKSQGITSKMNPNILLGAGVLGVLGLAYIFKG